MKKDYGKSQDDRFEQLHQHVHKTGCAIIYVFGEDDSPPFSYSMGFAQFGFPDVIITGSIAQKNAIVLINDLLSQWRENGVSLGLNDRLIHGFSMNLVEVNPKPDLYDNYVVQAVEFYSRYPECNPSGELPKYVQMVWPDPQGRFPNDKDYDHARFLQPILVNLVETSH